MATKALKERSSDGNGRVRELGKLQEATHRWTVDASRSTVEFEVKTFWGLSTVHGRFRRFEGFYDPEAHDGPALQLRIDADSLDTRNTMRDTHLRAGGFFDAVAHPHVRFTSTSVDKVDGTLAVAGHLEARGRQIALAFDAAERSYGDELEIETTTTVDQRELGMTFSPLGMIFSPATLHVKARLTPGPR
jgi:polyisoprenoid-binding protein YceI